MKITLKDLTLDEKLTLLTGLDFWRLNDLNGKLPKVFMSDGPSGLRMVNDDDTTKIATAMPTLSSVANTWNKEMAYLDGNTIADECVENGADILLAPGVNIKRTPLCGRNFEYFSEDPFLSGELGKAFVEGVQAKGVGTSLKHYCANNREVARLHRSNEVDERTLREIYLPAFEKVLQAKPWTVMCSYNLINGIYASEHKYLLNDILRKLFGFEGLIVSDWGAVHNAYKAVRATLDLRMWGVPENTAQLKAAYEKGLLTIEEIDFCAQNVLNLMEKVESANKKVEFTKEQRHQKAVKIAEEAIVLLKNEDNILPLNGGKIGVIDMFKGKPPIGGGGSSTVNSDYKIPVLSDALKAVGIETEYLPLDILSRVKAAVYKAYEVDTVVLTVGEGSDIEAECFDRNSIKLKPLIEDLICEVAKINPNVVVLVHAGSAIDMSGWIDKVKGVVMVGYLGEAVNEALANVLSGKEVPSGKLNETYPLCIEDNPADVICSNYESEIYKEGIMVGYRYYDTFNKDVLFPFGYGLSYVNFEYSDIKVEKHSETDYTVSYTITNSGDTDAKEVSQVYVKDVFASVTRPEKELKGFSKDLIPAKGSKRISVDLNFRSFAYYSTSLHDWHIQNGDFEILVGASSRDIRLKEKINIALPDDTQFSY